MQLRGFCEHLLYVGAVTPGLNLSAQGGGLALVDQAKQAPLVCTATAPRDEPEVTGKEQLQQEKTILNEEERTTWCSM